MRSLILLASLSSALACGPGDGGDTASATETATAATVGTDSSDTATTPPTTTGDSTGGIPTGPECQEDADCVLINSCCQCSATPADAEVPECGMECLQPTCDALGLTDVTVACRSGICVFAPATCSDGPVECDEEQPQCLDDDVNTVKDNCWGPCMHPRYCEGGPCTADSCGNGWTCVNSQSGASRCVRIPHECAGTPTCACMQPYLDEFCGGSCGDVEGGVLCEDGG